MGLNIWFRLMLHLVMYFTVYLVYYTSVGEAPVATFSRLLIFLLRRWTWYIFSAATHDLGLSSGGIVMPYSQPSTEYSHSSKRPLQYRQSHLRICKEANLFHLLPFCHQSSTHPSTSTQEGTQSPQGDEPSLHSEKREHAQNFPK